MNLDIVRAPYVPPTQNLPARGRRRRAGNLLAPMTLALLPILAMACSNSPQKETVSATSSLNPATPVRDQEAPPVQPTDTATTETPTPTALLHTATPASTPTPVPLASIGGLVLDQASGQPVADAVVSAGSAQASTDADGSYRTQFSYVRPEGYPPAEDSQITQGCKYDSSITKFRTVKGFCATNTLGVVSGRSINDTNGGLSDVSNPFLQITHRGSTSGTESCRDSGNSVASKSQWGSDWRTTSHDRTRLRNQPGTHRGAGSE